MSILDMFRKKQRVQDEFPSPKPPRFLPEEFEKFRLPPRNISTPPAPGGIIPRQPAEPGRVIGETPEGIPRPKELTGIPERYEPIEIVSRAGQVPYSQPTGGPESEVPTTIQPTPISRPPHQEYDRISLILQKLETIDARLKLIEERLRKGQ